MTLDKRCSRCGAQRPTLEACPECGYVPEHPGVLGAYRDAVGRLVEQPSLLLPFLVPTLVLAGTQGLLLQVGAEAAIGAPSQAAAGLVALFLQVAWYLITVGTITPTVQSDSGLALPAPPVIVGGVLGGLLVTSPWILVATMLVVQPAGALGAAALLSSVLLLIGAVFVAGRAIGIPVEAAISHRTGMDLLKAGNARGRENGGLGLVFLALLLLGALTVIPGILAGTGTVELAPAALLTMGAVTSWILGAWIGVAFAIGLVGIDEAATTTVTCPACGQEATMQAGRARCACGLEGPYYRV